MMATYFCLFFVFFSFCPSQHFHFISQKISLWFMATHSSPIETYAFLLLLLFKPFFQFLTWFKVTATLLFSENLPSSELSRHNLNTEQNISLLKQIKRTAVSQVHKSWQISNYWMEAKNNIMFQKTTGPLDEPRASSEVQGPAVLGGFIYRGK